MLNWTEKFASGHELIDAQHRMLISYINRLEGLSGNRHPGPEEIELFVRFIQFLEDYLVEHFREEEECMMRFRCPAHQENQRAHAEFLDFFREFKLRFGTEGDHPDAARELFQACEAWVQRHILRIDVQLRPCQTPYYEPEESE